MGLFNFGKKKVKYQCSRCKKKILDEKFEWIGSHRFCRDCAKPPKKSNVGTQTKNVEEKPRIPSSRVIKEEQKLQEIKAIIEETKKIAQKREQEEQKIPESVRCHRCNKKVRYGEHASIGEYHFCTECAVLPEGWALNDKGERFCLHYPADDLVGEDRYWSYEVDKINSRRQWQKYSGELEDSGKCVGFVAIRTTEDPQYATDREYDWDVAIGFYENSETGKCYFKLEESFPSMWDGSPVYCGGVISMDEAKEYLHRIGNHKYDYLF